MMNLLACGLLAGMALLMTADVVARYVFNAPFQMVYEFTTQAMGALCGLGLAFALDEGKHIRVTLITDRWGPRGRHIWLFSAYAVLLPLAGVAAWLMVRFAIKYTLLQEMEQIVRWLPIYPFKIVLAIGMCLLALGVLLKFIEGITRLRSGDYKGYV